MRERAQRIYHSSAVRFLAGGFVTFASTLLIMGLWLGLIGIPNLVAYALTHVTVLAIGFALNRYWIFRAGDGNIADQGIRFVLANLAFRALDWCIYSAIALLLGSPVVLNVLVANALVLPMKFLFYRHQVFAAPAEDRGDLMERSG